MNSIHAQGKRKRAIARVTLSSGNGKVTINGRLLSSWEDEVSKLRMLEPLQLAGDIAQQLNLDVVTVGGGLSGQADAVRLAIARALVTHKPQLKNTFIAYDRLLLVADVRRREVRKPNDSKARAKRQKSYR